MRDSQAFPCTTPLPITGLDQWPHLPPAASGDQLPKKPGNSQRIPWNDTNSDRNSESCDISWHFRTFQDIWFQPVSTCFNLFQCPFALIRSIPRNWWPCPGLAAPKPPWLLAASAIEQGTNAQVNNTHTHTCTCIHISGTQSWYWTEHARFIWEHRLFSSNGDFTKINPPTRVPSGSVEQGPHHGLTGRQIEALNYWLNILNLHEEHQYLNHCSVASSHHFITRPGLAPMDCYGVTIEICCWNLFRTQLDLIQQGPSKEKFSKTSGRSCLYP